MRLQYFNADIGRAIRKLEKDPDHASLNDCMKICAAIAGITYEEMWDRYRRMKEGLPIEQPNQ